MSDALTFFVPGTPLPKQSTRFDGNGHAHTDTCPYAAYLKAREK